MSHNASALAALAATMFLGGLGIAFVLMGGVRRLREKPSIKQFDSYTVSTGFLSGRIALKKFPELDGLNKMQRLVILNYLQTNYGSVSHSRLTEVGMVGIIILGEISGLVAGWICMPGVVGPVMGASVALLLLMGSFAAVNSLVLRYITLPRIHDFLHSRAGQELIDGTIDLYGF